MLKLFFAELRCSWIQFRRYPIESVGQIIFTTAIFYGLFLGAGYIAGTIGEEYKMRPKLAL